MKKKSAKSRRKSPAKGKIWIFATDPYSQVDLQPLWTLIRPLAEKDHARVEATYVLAPSNFNWNGDFTPPWFKRYRPGAEEKLTEALAGSDVIKTVLNCKGSGLRDSVNTLCAYAKKTKAEFILVSTHARSGLERLTLGSFAETLILTTNKPVILANPAKKMPTVLRKILVATDLERKSAKATLATVELAKRWGAEVVLYHKRSDPRDPVVQQGVYSLGGGWTTLESFTEGELRDKTQKLEHLEAKILKMKVNVSHVYDETSTSLVEGIERAAREAGADMISVATGATALRAAVLGSVARELVRTASLPVLVWR